MNDMKSLADKFHAKLDARDRRKRPRAKTGYLRSDGTITVVGDAAHDDGRLGPNLIYVTMEDRSLAVVYAPDFGRQPNIDVELEQSPWGYWQIYGLNAPRSTEKLGEQAALAAQADIRIDQNASVLVGSLNLLPGRVRNTLGGAGTLEVTVENFAYTDSADVERIFQADTPTLAAMATLTFTMPAQSSSVDQHGYIRLSFDPDATTPALAQTAGTPKFVTLPLTTADADATTTPTGHIPLWDIPFTSASATLPDPHTWIDRRPWLSGGCGRGFDSDAIMVDSDFSIMIDADYNVMIGS